jgi:hypothetical protein
MPLLVIATLMIVVAVLAVLGGADSRDYESRWFPAA